jgi:ABC-type lipoprotein export system ATPase subunit
VAELLAALGVAHRARAWPHQLSGGELARGALAVALANQPPVVLADEPTGELDEGTEQRLLSLLRRRAELGCAVLVASHSDAVRAAADRVLVLVDGRLAACAATLPSWSATARRALSDAVRGQWWQFTPWCARWPLASGSPSWVPRGPGSRPCSS